MHQTFEDPKAGTERYLLVLGEPLVARARFRFFRSGHRTVGVWGSPPQADMRGAPGPRTLRTGAPDDERVTGIEPALSAWEPYKTA